MQGWVGKGKSGVTFLPAVHSHTRWGFSVGNSDAALLSSPAPSPGAAPPQPSTTFGSPKAVAYTAA